MSVAIVAAPGSLCAWVRLNGDVDLAAEPALVEVVDLLHSADLRLMVVDMAAVTFAGSTLVHFLDALHRWHPTTALVLRHASPMVHHIVRVTGLDRCVDVSDGPVPAADDLEHQPPTAVVNARCDEEPFNDDRARLLRQRCATGHVRPSTGARVSQGPEATVIRPTVFVGGNYRAS